MRAILARSAIPRFDRTLHHSSVPTKIRKAAARSGGPGRPLGRREALYPGRARARRHACVVYGTAACTPVTVVVICDRAG